MWSGEILATGTVVQLTQQMHNLNLSRPINFNWGWQPYFKHLHWYISAVPAVVTENKKRQIRQTGKKTRKIPGDSILFHTHQGTDLE